MTLSNDNRVRVGHALIVGILLAGVTEFILTACYTQSDSYNVFLSFGAVATVLCGILAVTRSRGGWPEKLRSDPRERRGLIVLAGPIYLWNIAMLFGAALGANGTNGGLEVAFVANLFGAALFGIWLGMQLTVTSEVHTQ